ncbi:class I SAM-dependent methyltransferase [Pseudophaeobacter flagellatus]|uniref:class I SAM-dependent methyltransferase n=1 Tax=Pseudophaeobacter flagellatus TaxID=2899119 RepID=UPI001E5D8AE8|nr:methyltransferase domain-containing protein [Pseudophaeobacter flagellatus]MCD9149820.1 methyltransferase domain-containing protein [Pseudophaeobacter flagellatus]
MTTNAASAGQVSRSAAEIYDEFFVPALFGEWASPLCDAAAIEVTHNVLDVACGTGATTREAASRIGSGGRIVGLDRNAGMLSVAQKHAPGIKWVEGLAEALPFDNHSFDVVLCQFGLMFFDDRSKALHEMRRVLRPGSRIALSVWDAAANSPGYACMIQLIDEMFGQSASDALGAPFVLGDRQAFQNVLKAGGLDGAAVTTISGVARFASIREWVRMDVRGWTLSDFIDDDGFEALVAAAETRLDTFAAADGTVEFPAPAHVAVWTRE